TVAFPIYNFFDLGGHSLMATQVLSRMRQTFGMEFPLQSLFEYPNVATLAEEIETMLIVAQDVLQSVGEVSVIQQENEETGEL
ncbi:MAG: nonribosomal peptide synthetase, partial [Moorea sp. SIO4A3]|nr:nonribosomal peptide synthetase [Moorena sp. SIO4A3]